MKSLVMVYKKLAIGDILRRVFAHSLFEPTEAKRSSLVPVEEPDKNDWLAKILLFFHLRTRENENISGQFVFMQNIETTPPLDAVDKTLNCILLRLATDDELVHTLDVKGMLTFKIEVGEWLGVDPFTSIVSVHHIVRSN